MKGDALETVKINLTLTQKMKDDLEAERKETYARSIQELIVTILGGHLEKRKKGEK